MKACYWEIAVTIDAHLTACKGIALFVDSFVKAVQKIIAFYSLTFGKLSVYLPQLYQRRRR
jgi:hypothetical protein